VESYLHQYGQIPLPAYIRRDGHEAELPAMDKKRYQTVYAANEGAVAAPTAGLHFSQGLIESIKDKGVEVSQITLHVGPGTFLPVRCQDLDLHKMHPERYVLSESSVRSITTAKQEGRRVVAVGTTVVRTLEGAFDHGLHAGCGMTDIFIRPGFKFRVVDALVTNFHLPGSTLIMLVSAFAGRERILSVYQQAVEEAYRFYSYGDAMFLAGKCE
jgi:S-adenosylmethionine:tRNA ribosyltransferase-isomerase